MVEQADVAGLDLAMHANRNSGEHDQHSVFAIGLFRHFDVNLF